MHTSEGCVRVTFVSWLDKYCNEVDDAPTMEAVAGETAEAERTAAVEKAGSDVDARVGGMALPTLGLSEESPTVAASNAYCANGLNTPDIQLKLSHSGNAST